MADYETILFERDGPIARITLNRPDRLNSFNQQMHGEIADVFREQLEDSRVVVLTGSGRGFCAGQDLNDRAVSADGHPVDLGMTVETAWNPLVRNLTGMSIPIIARVNGVAAGNGIYGQEDRDVDFTVGDIREWRADDAGVDLPAVAGEQRSGPALADQHRREADLRQVRQRRQRHDDVPHPIGQPDDHRAHWR